MGWSPALACLVKLQEIQEQLRKLKLDGWLLFDHHVRDPIAYRVLNLDSGGHVSRRWYYWIPAQGDPAKLVHAIENARLDSLPGNKNSYSSWQSQHEMLRKMLSGAGKIAMQYSANCMIPTVSLVDGGTVDLVRSLGIDVVTSAALVQYFEARWTQEQKKTHFEAGRKVDAVLQEAFKQIRADITAQGSSGEFVIAKFIQRRFKEEGLVADDGPIVAVNANSGNPHYSPERENSQPIHENDFVLIDLWAKLAIPGSVYYDITWTGFCGDTPPASVQSLFEIVSMARNKALAFVNDAIREGQTVQGWQVDDVTRSHIADAGFGDKFVHRTGHSIGEEVHGNGANLDNLETRDERPIIPATCFSIEPGIYLPEHGLRSEIDCYISETGACATGVVQEQIVRI